MSVDVLHKSEIPEKKDTPEEKPKSMLRKTRRYFLGVMGIILLDSARTLIPVAQPKKAPESSNAGYPDDPLPSPDLPIDDLMMALETDEEVEKFLSKYATHKMPVGVCNFIYRYGQSPEAFQQSNFTGPCNQFTEFWCYWGHMHNKKMYVVSMRPLPEEDLEEGEEPQTQWHSIAAYKRRNPESEEMEYVIYDNAGRYTSASLEEYVKADRFYIPSVVGILRWQRRQDDPRAKWFRHIVDSVGNLEETIEPQLNRPLPTQLVKGA